MLCIRSPSPLLRRSCVNSVGTGIGVVAGLLLALASTIAVDGGGSGGGRGSLFLLLLLLRFTVLFIY